MRIEPTARYELACACGRYAIKTGAEIGSRALPAEDQFGEEHLYHELMVTKIGGLSLLDRVREAQEQLRKERRL